MARRDIIVVGVSAGGVEALTSLVRGLPPELEATLFIILHVPAQGTSVLPPILSNAGPLPAVHPEDGDAIEAGRIYVAPPDYHLLPGRDGIRLARGPRENGLRPEGEGRDRAGRAVGARCREAAVRRGDTIDRQPAREPAMAQHPTLYREIVRLQERLDGFRRRRSVSEEHVALLEEMLEELQVAEEELRQQNDMLGDSLEAAAQAERRYRELFEFAPDGYLVTDPAGLIREVNRAGVEML